MDDSYKIIVCRYNEDISWLDSEVKNCVIYNKGDKLNISNEILAPNVGRESETYLNYIISNYDRLPEVCVFTQANIKDHLGSNNVEFLLKLKDEALLNLMSMNFIVGSDRGCLSRSWSVVAKTDNYKKEKITFENWFTNNIRDIYPNFLKYYRSGIFAINKENILSKPKEFYEKLILEVNYHVNPAEGHYFERSWYYIFND